MSCISCYNPYDDCGRCDCYDDCCIDPFDRQFYNDCSPAVCCSPLSSCDEWGTDCGTPFCYDNQWDSDCCSPMSCCSSEYDPYMCNTNATWEKPKSPRFGGRPSRKDRKEACDAFVKYYIEEKCDGKNMSDGARDAAPRTPFDAANTAA